MYCKLSTKASTLLGVFPFLNLFALWSGCLRWYTLDSYAAVGFFYLSLHYVALAAGYYLCSVREGWWNLILQITSAWVQ